MQLLFFSLGFGFWIMIAFWFMPKVLRRDRCVIMIKEAGKYCLFANRFVSIFEIIYLNDMDVKEILLCWDRLCALLNQHNFEYDPDFYYSYLDLEPILYDRYSDNKISYFFEKKAVTRFLKKKSIFPEDVK